ncbi:hypothetical protein [Ekhidna sp.]|uniref:tetratricopeptide repeat protein n=1 Tax=Ekhidna sp. TaxID=2608089 RepID=UPI0032988B63
MDELRDKYLQGKLTEAEEEAFLKNLSDEERMELAYELGVRDETTLREIRSRIQGFKDKNAHVRKINPAYIGIAASIFLAATLVFYFTGNQQPLFDQYYQVYPNYELTTVRNEENLSNRQLAYAAYDVGDYTVAIAEFNKLDSLGAPDHFFRGVSYIQIQNFEAAFIDFQQVIVLGDKSYENAAIWYSALIHIKLENNEKAIPLLEKLGSGQSDFAATSRELLAQL